MVKDLMTKTVVTVGPEVPLKEAVKILKEKRISGLPVLDKTGIVIGVITISDVLKMLEQIYGLKETEKKSPDLKLSDMYEEEKASAKVGDVMATEVYTVQQEDSLEKVMRLMFHNKVHTIPVVDDNGKLVGVVGKRDMMYACF